MAVNTPKAPEIFKASDEAKAAEAAKGRVSVYKRGSVPGQIDHPGWISKVVEGPSAVEGALAEGWSLTMSDPKSQGGKPKIVTDLR